MGAITKRMQNGKTYYVYQETYRVKVDENLKGKYKGSGKSKVCTRATYLGTAEDIFKMTKTDEPQSVVTREFGLCAAAYQTAEQIGLIEILKKYVQDKTAGIPQWIYLLVTILNRIGYATSKNKMSEWLSKTILPQLLNFDSNKLTSKNFWYASDDIVSEKQLRENRNQQDLYAGLTDDVLNKIETELFQKIDNLMHLAPDTIFYDTTNFFTYIQPKTPSQLAKTCHSKASKHHLKHIGLLMAVEKKYGIPLLNRIYKPNTHDSKIFSNVLANLIINLKKLCNSNIVLILDKGNNSPENFQYMKDKISWIGALVPTQHKDILQIDLSQYQNYEEKKYYVIQKNIMEIDCKLIMTFSPSTKRKQEHTLFDKIEKLKTQLFEQWNKYKKIPKTIPTGINTIIKENEYGTCITVSTEDGKLFIQNNHLEIEKKKEHFGKNLIFTNMLDSDPIYIINTYLEKNTIEDDFKLLKDHTIICFQPIRHWTDSKIRVYAFCCVMAMTLLRVMQWKVEQTDYSMSPKALTEELSDIQEVIMIYGINSAKRKITTLSKVQSVLWGIFNLEQIKNNMLLH